MKIKVAINSMLRACIRFMFLSMVEVANIHFKTKLEVFRQQLSIKYQRPVNHRQVLYVYNFSFINCFVFLSFKLFNKVSYKVFQNFSDANLYYYFCLSNFRSRVGRKKKSSNRARLMVMAESNPICAFTVNPEKLKMIKPVTRASVVTHIAVPTVLNA